VRAPPPSPSIFSGAAGRRMAWLCGTALVLAALALNRRVIDFDFLYLRDDDVNVTLNPHMGGLDLARLRWMFTDGGYVRRYIPLGWLNFSATYEAAGLDPAPYHAVALGLYALNTALVFLLLLLALRLFVRRAGDGALGAWEAGAAALAAAWWAMSPLRVETTAWISGNLYGQAMALLLVSVIAYLRTYTAAGARRTLWLAVSAVAYAASLLTYPIGLGVPVLLAGLDWLRTRAGGPVGLRRLLLEKAVFLAPLAAVLAVTVAARFANTEVFGPVPGMRDLPLASRLAQSAYVAAYYVWKPWWPFHLSPLYDTLMDFRAGSPVFVASMVAVAAACLAALLNLRRRPAVAVLVFGYLAAAAPFFGLTEKPHMASDRYGCFLIAIMAGLGAAGLARIKAPRARAAALAAALALIAALGWLTWRQLDVWADDRAQHAYVVAGIRNEELRDDFTSRQLILEFMRGDEQAASAALAERLRARPTRQGYLKAAAIFAEKRRISAYYGPVSYFSILQERLGLEFARAGEWREADDHFADALRMSGRFYQAAYDRALVLLHLGRWDDALRSYLIALHSAPAGLTPEQRRAFLGLLAQASDAAGRPGLARAARLELAR
jgi:protein O-mannosyl-transferase